jgi:hypothetical protein
VVPEVVGSKPISHPIKRASSSTGRAAVSKTASWRFESFLARLNKSNISRISTVKQNNMYVTKVNYQLEDGHKTTAEFTNKYGHPMEGFVELDEFYIRFRAEGSNRGMRWESVAFNQESDEEMKEVFVKINEVTFVQ